MRPRRFLLGWFVPALLVCQQPEGKFTIAGIVRNSVTGSPVRQALVTLVPPPSGRNQVITDPGGAFRFEGLQARRYRLLVSKPGFKERGPGEGLEVAV